MTFSQASSKIEAIPTGQINVREIFMEHSNEIFLAYLEKVPYEIPGNIPK